MNRFFHKGILAGLLAAVLLLGACGNGDTEPSGEKENTAKETEVGKENQITDKDKEKEEPVEDAGLPPLKPAADIPKEEEKALMAVMKQHIDAFNSKDLDRYMETLSKKPESFSYDDEKDYMKKVFSTMDLEMSPKQMFIIEYSDKEASVFTDMKTRAVDPESKKEIVSVTRQINTLRKEEGGWKMIATFAMENPK